MFYLVREQRSDLDHPSVSAVSLYQVSPNCLSAKWGKGWNKKLVVGRAGARGQVHPMMMLSCRPWRAEFPLF